MNKLSAFAVLIGLLGCAASIFATMELRKVSASVSALEDRLAGLEKTTAIPAPAGDPGKPGVSDSVRAPATMADVASEIVRLRKEVAEVRTAQEASGPSTAPATVARTDKPVVSGSPAPDDVKRAVEEVLAAREEEQRKEEAKRDEERQARRNQELVNALAEQLGLTEQQKTQVSAIVTKQSAAMRELWTNRKEGEEIRPKMDEIRKEGETQIKALLSAEQQTKFDEVSRLFQGGGGGRGRGQGGGGGGPRGGN